jgi:hypothetical protein
MRLIVFIPVDLCVNNLQPVGVEMIDDLLKQRVFILLQNVLKQRICFGLCR